VESLVGALVEFLLEGGGVVRPIADIASSISVVSLLLVESRVVTQPPVNTVYEVCVERPGSVRSKVCVLG
jgi:hypothetical protein